MLSLRVRCSIDRMARRYTADYMRIGEVAQTVGVSVDTLRRREVEGHVTFERRGTWRVLHVDSLAQLLAWADQRSSRSSSRNRLDGVVVQVDRDAVTARVELICGDFRLVSLMSRHTADELGLEPGVRATAVVKSANVVVDRTMRADSTASHGAQCTFAELDGRATVVTS
ncbi:hypothetical protein GCM10028772_13430 [Nocardioides ultimimeridianus]